MNTKRTRLIERVAEMKLEAARDELRLAVAARKNLEDRAVLAVNQYQRATTLSDVALRRGDGEEWMMAQSEAVIAECNWNDLQLKVEEAGKQCNEAEEVLRSRAREREQVDALVTELKKRHQIEAARVEQQRLDEWFLISRRSFS